MKIILFNLLVLLFAANNTVTIESDKARWKPYYTDTAPAAVADTWVLPFDLTNRKDIKQIRIVSIFGDHRDSYVKGHMHTAIDINPAQPKTQLINVYPMAKGVVCSVHLGENQRTVVIKHKLPNGKFMFTSYKHLKEVYVSNGQQVDQNVKIARLFTKQESKKYGGDYHHLHLEIRRIFDDYGCASWLTFNQKELDLRFYNPQAFLKENLKRS